MTSMVIMDSIDILNLVNGDWVDLIPPYIGDRQNRHASDLTYTVEVMHFMDTMDCVDNIDTWIIVLIPPMEKPHCSIVSR